MRFIVPNPLLAISSMPLNRSYGGHQLLHIYYLRGIEYLVRTCRLRDSHSSCMVGTTFSQCIPHKKLFFVWFSHLLNYSTFYSLIQLFTYTLISVLDPHMLKFPRYENLPSSVAPFVGLEEYSCREVYCTHLFTYSKWNIYICTFF